MGFRDSLGFKNIYNIMPTNTRNSLVKKTTPNKIIDAAKKTQKSPQIVKKTAGKPTTVPQKVAILESNDTMLAAVNTNTEETLTLREEIGSLQRLLQVALERLDKLEAENNKMNAQINEPKTTK